MNTPITLTISLSDEVQSLPYSGTKTGYHYVSLLERPGSINAFPELKDEPVMTSFILGIHSPGWSFETARIDHGYFDGENGSVIRRTAIGFFFRNTDLFRNYTNCLMFAGNLLRAAQIGTIESDQQFLLEIQPVTLRRQFGIQGWLMDLYFSGRGSDKDAARNRLDQLLQKALPFFENCGMSAPSIPDES